MTALTSFASECKAVGVSSAAHKPKPVAVVHHGSNGSGLSWTTPYWPTGNDGVDAFQVNFTVSNTAATIPPANCPATGLLAQGTTSGKRGTSTTINVVGNGSAIRVLRTWLSPTTVKWAVITCKTT
jgi:hypothetical protein